MYRAHAQCNASLFSGWGRVARARWARGLGAPARARPKLVISASTFQNQGVGMEIHQSYSCAISSPGSV